MLFIMSISFMVMSQSENCSKARRSLTMSSTIFSALDLSPLLRSAASEEEEEDVLDMDEVLAPKKPLDLGRLCKDLGLMEEGE